MRHKPTHNCYHHSCHANITASHREPRVSSDISKFSFYHRESLGCQKLLSSPVHHQVAIIQNQSYLQVLIIYIGIGKYSAIALSKAGWNVVLIARREQELQETAAQCPNPALVLPGDVTDESFIKKAFEVTTSHFGRYHRNAWDNICIVGSQSIMILLLITRQNRSTGPAI